MADRQGAWPDELPHCTVCSRTFSSRRQYDRHTCNKRDGRLRKAAPVETAAAEQPGPTGSPSPPASPAAGQPDGADEQPFAFPPGTFSAEEADAAARLLQQVLGQTQLPNWLAGVDADAEDSDQPSEDARQQTAAC